MFEERWLPVVGAEGEYEVSDRGRVLSLERITRRRLSGGGMRNCRVQQRILSLRVHPDGHLTVHVGKGNRYVHTLVLEAFVGPRPEGKECRHLNGNPADNRLDNLCWSTHSRNGLDVKYHREPRNWRLSPEDSREVKVRLRAGARVVDVAKAFGVSVGCISSIKFGRSHRDVR
jgi:hypothetical protein